MIPRLVTTVLEERLLTMHKAVLLLGARQVGKTTLLKVIQEEMENQGNPTRYLNCDISEEYQLINTTSSTILDRLVDRIQFIFIDEIQRLDNPGLTLKILVDTYPGLHILATGSSSFELRHRMSESLTGRYIDIHLFPFSLDEILASSKVAGDQLMQKTVADALLPDIFKYGLYPEIYLEPNPLTKQLLLKKLVESYLFRDVLSYQRIRYSQTIIDLARALAYQIGQEVNDNELSKRLKIDRKTVMNYIDILERSFVILRLSPYSKNPRREIGKQNKIYFLDLGIRNALIGDFNDLSIRPDRGALWENFLIVERIKSYLNRGTSVQSRFWRSYSGAEVDYIEEIGAGKLQAYEFKVSASRNSKGAISFENNYGVDVQLVNMDNYLEFIR